MRRPRIGTIAAWCTVPLAGVLAALLRYRLVEPPELADYCASAGLRAPLWCGLRELVVQGFLHDVYGIAALIATAFALLRPRRWSASIAAAAGIAAIQLYCYETGALALLAGCLLLVRSVAPARPRDPGGVRQQDVQPQP